MQKKKKLFIFDLDGTLVDAYRAIEKSLNFTRRLLKLPPVSYGKIKKNIGRGDKNFVKTFFPGANAKPALEIYREHHKGALKKYARLKPNAKKLLFILKRKHKIVSIASNRPAAYTHIIVKKTGIGKYLDFVLCADEINSLKPKPKIIELILKKFKTNKEDALYAGDMDIDLETAIRAGVDPVFVLGGSSRLSDVAKYSDKKVVRSLTQIAKIYA